MRRVAVWVWIVAAAISAGAQDFYLKDGDTVVMYGDSITEQNYYNQYVELYTVTRFPRWQVRFYGAGVGGDTVRGGFGGTVDERLQREVFSRHPSVVTVMLGMNDGGYQPISKEIDEAYEKGYEHVIASIREHAPGARLTLLGPSPYDDFTRPPEFEGGYNGAILHLDGMAREQAVRSGARFTDLNPAVVALIERVKKTDPRLALQLLPDRVHPEPVAHWVMAEAILKGWGAPAVVSRVRLDAGTAKAVESDHATVEDVERGAESLRWRATEQALPLPLKPEQEIQRELIESSDIEEALNQEMLTVTGLAAGRWKLSIDGEQVGTFEAAQLRQGVNLALYPTPMLQQAEQVGWLVRDRALGQYVRMRMQIQKVDLGHGAGDTDPVDAFLERQSQKIRETAAPKPHSFALILER